MPASRNAPSARRAGTRKSRSGAPRKTPSRPPAAESHDILGLAAVAKQLRSWTDSVLGIAGAAADVSVGAAKAMLVKPNQRAALERTGSALRALRERAGLSLGEVGAAINLKDPTLLDLVEHGKIALPFEIILRLASVLGRNDPISFVMRFTRSYNPDVWGTLEALGIGRLALQAGREREFANIYRASDVARRLSDDEFAATLQFVQAAFDLALTFQGRAASPRKGGRDKRGAP